MYFWDMPFKLVVLATVIFATPLFGQHEHEHGTAIHFGVHAVGLVTKASPATLNRDLTEGYLTQPAVSVMGDFWRSRLVFAGMLNLEGWTLKRGELNHSVWGEGYIDRRHPHTYLHEAVATAQTSPEGKLGASLSIGRGFAPFGSDDPMVRPFVKYPSNHHLAQILEREVAIGAVRYGPAMLEFGKFNGDEPTGPSSLGQLSHFGDSWSVRGTVRPIEGVELQASDAKLTSPEQPHGGGLDQHKQSLSARVATLFGRHDVYGLIEWARTNEGRGTFKAFSFTSFLAEAAVTRSGWRVASRYENTTRPEEERRENLFRSIRPSTDNSILGTTRWKTLSVALSRSVTLPMMTIEPFGEVSHSVAEATDPFPVYQPADLFGSDRIWTFSAGIKLNAGMKHTRMGRYGAAN